MENLSLWLSLGSILKEIQARDRVKLEVGKGLIGTEGGLDSVDRRNELPYLLSSPRFWANGFLIGAERSGL